MVKHLKARLSISRTMGHSKYGDNWVTLSVEDKSSLTMALEIQMSAETFGMLVMGLSFLEVEADWHVDNLGLCHEHKEEIVSIGREQSRSDALKSFEVDGWKGQESDLKNTHRAVNFGKDTNDYKVRFFRFVEKKSDET